MSETKPRRERYVPLWGLFLLFLGIVFLLQTLGVLPWGLWGTLWRFWPVLIIATGLNILLKRYNTWLVGALILVLLSGSLGIAIWQYQPSPSAVAATKSYSAPLGTVESARVQINFDAGRLVMGSLPGSSTSFVEAASGKRPGDMKADFRIQDSEGTLLLSTERFNRQFWDEADTEWEVSLTRAIPLTMEIKAAVSNLELDLSELQVTELEMDVDVGNYVVTMPASAGTTRAFIKADVANVEVTIPEGVAARIKVETDLGTFGVDESRFPRKGGYYLSPDFDSSTNRVDLELDCDIGRIRVN